VSVVTEKSLAEAVYKVNKIFAGKCMNEHAAHSILSNIIHLLGSSADINECEVKYHRGRYLNSFFITIRRDSILFAIDMAEDDCIKKFDYTKPTFIQWLNENEEGKQMETATKSIEGVLESLARYYTGQKNTLETASEMFKGLISAFGLIVPADDILICKSLVVPAIFIQGKGKVNLIELHECERELIINVVYNTELVYMFLKQYKTKEETKMEELEGFSIPTLIEDDNKGYVPFLEIVGKMGEGDIIESAGGAAIMKELDTYFWCKAETGETSNIVELRGTVLQMKFRFYIPYVGWREAFEAYENGHRIECEYNGEWVWFCRDITSLEESSMLADKQLDGLLTTKWIIKERNRK